MKEIAATYKFGRFSGDIRFKRWYAEYMINDISKRANIHIFDWHDVVDNVITESFNWKSKSWQKDVRLDNMDLLYFPMPDNMMRDVKKYITFLESIEKQSLPCVNNPRTMINNFDKSYLFFLENHDIPVPETRRVSPSIKGMYKLARKGNFIIKPLKYGEGGRGLREILDMTGEDMLKYIDKYKENGIIAQPILEDITTFGEISIPIIGDKILYGVRKKPVEGNIFCNEDRGAELILTNPTRKQEKIIREILEIWPDETDISRVDMTGNEDGYVITEVEMVNPALYTEYLPIKNRNFVSETLADYLINKCKR